MTDIDQEAHNAPPGPLLAARGLVVDYPGVRALDEVDFELSAGEVHAVMGENGAGKSTLINILSGLRRPDSGSISLAGLHAHFSSSSEAERAGISTVHQEIDLIPTLSVAENICLGRFSTRSALISWRDTRSRAAAALNRVGASINPRRRLDSCSIAEQQLVAIARALDVDCRILILDEPTSSLDSGEVTTLLDLIRRLRAQGLGIILITHFLDQAYAIADRFTILRNGSRVGTWAAKDLPRTALIEAMTGRTITAIDHRARSNAQDSEPLVRIRTLGRRRSIEPTSTTIAHAEAVGVAGLLGSGRTELARLIFGADEPDSGRIEVDGRSVKPGSIRDAIRRGIAMTPEDRKAQGLFLDLSIRDNITLAMQARRGGLRPIPANDRTRLADHYIAALRIKAPSVDAPVRTLSGGNQQKVLLARWLAMQPRLLILDEPTRGIDVGARADIESLLASLRDAGLSILLISTEVDEITRVCSRALILRDRRCIGELAGDSLTEQNILACIAS